MKTQNKLFDRKFLRKMSEHLGVLDRTWLKKGAAAPSYRRTERKLKSLWLSWDQDPTVRPVICQRIKQLTYQMYFHEEQTIKEVAKKTSEAISADEIFSSNEIFQRDGQKLLKVVYQNGGEKELNLYTILQGALSVSETSEHQKDKS